MPTLNRIEIMGHLGKDPEIRYVASGDAVATFSVAVSEKFGKGENRRERTDWFSVTAWKATAELAKKYLTKGAAVYVEGRMQSREWEKDGIKRTSWEINANNIQMLGSRGERQELAASAPAEQSYGDAGIDDSAIPF